MSDNPCPPTCANCAAVCCRLTVPCVGEHPVPAHLVEDDGRGLPTMRRLADGWCAALDRVQMCCGIYARRPLPCREFMMGGVDCLAVRAQWAAGQALSLPEGWP